MWVQSAIAEGESCLVNLGIRRNGFGREEEEEEEGGENGGNGGGI